MNFLDDNVYIFLFFIDATLLFLISLSFSRKFTVDCYKFFINQVH